MQESRDLTAKGYIAMIGVMMILGIALFIYDYLQATYYFDSKLERGAAGSGVEINEMSLMDENGKHDIDVEISAVPFTEEEANAYLDEASDEMFDAIKGKNSSLDEVMYDLDFRQFYCNDLVEAKYECSSIEYITLDGKSNQYVLTEPVIVTAEVILKLEEYERICPITMRIVPWDSNTKEGFDYYLKKKLQGIDSSNRDLREIELPASLDDKYLIWQRRIDYRGIKLVIVSFLAAACMPLLSYNEVRKNRKIMQKQRLKDYPMIVNELSILMGAGMSIKSAFEKMSKRYMKKKNQGEIKEGYELILKTYRRMTEGIGEIEAIEIMGRESDVKEYRKLSMLLSQNLRKGNRELLTNLEREEVNAFELRKQLAMQAGEKASTKLLLPMGGMLGIIMTILLVPALLQINI